MKIRLLSATVAALMSLVITLVLGIVSPGAMGSPVLLAAVLVALWLTLNRAWYGFLRTDT